MGRINILDTKTANAIKAGEVIERPVSVVKELIDNAIDSGATRITVEFAGGGISLIRVTDDGCGMDREDAEKAFLIHATSKLHSIEEIYSLSTNGFRGEALASIAACSDVTLTTCIMGEKTGSKVVYEDGSLKGSAVEGEAQFRLDPEFLLRFVRDLGRYFNERVPFFRRHAPGEFRRLGLAVAEGKGKGLSFGPDRHVRNEFRLFPARGGLLRHDGDPLRPDLKFRRGQGERGGGQKRPKQFFHG